MRLNYNPQKIEKKWQRIWYKEKIFEPNLKKAKKPFYNLMMFPYPSAEGLHVGNMYAFVGADIYGKFKKYQGFDVFEPIGLDGFGIHSENYALKVGQHPMLLAKRTEKRFYQQLKSIGNSFAWNYRLETYDPAYYKWTQWLFLQMFKKGLAYRKSAPVNFCPSCKTVLADEQVIGGKCERCDSEVEIRNLRQWFFKITLYAEKLLKNLETLDWSEKVKIAQRNWIGKSEGAKVKFYLKEKDKFIEVFTTRIDTIFGATFLALSPFHPLLEELKDLLSKEAKDFIKKAKVRVKLEHQKEKKEGAFTGFKAVNPATGQEIPVWVTDYVLEGYGTSAIMGVPAHDQRDFEFAKTHNLPIEWVVFPKDGNLDKSKAFEEDGILQNSGKFTGLETKRAKEEILKWLKKRNLAQKEIQYHLRDWLISRQRYWGPPIPIIYCQNCYLNHSQKNKLREGVDFEIIEGKEHLIVPVPEKDLPVKLPFIENFKPLGTGKSPLANYPKFYQTKCPKCKASAIRETDVSDTFLDSSWYFLRYPSVKVKDRPFDPKITQKWLPVDSYIGGAEHSVLHLLYSRFVTMVLKDLKFIDFEEPFKKFRAHGLIISQGAKMSKSRGNVIVPDEYIQKYGADTLRTYLMFLGPFEQGGDFRDEGILGIWRFLNRVFNLGKSLINFKGKTKKETKEDLEKLLHQTIKKVQEDVESLKYNTAISSLMIFLNSYQKALENKELSLKDAKSLFKPFLIMLSLFAPHLAEELWQNLFAKKRKNFKSIFQERWPKFDPKKIKEETFSLIVQVQGKVRDVILAPKGISQKEALRLALSSPKVSKWIPQDAKIKKVIFVKDKLINILV